MIASHRASNSIGIGIVLLISCGVKTQASRVVYEESSSFSIPPPASDLDDRPGRSRSQRTKILNEGFGSFIFFGHI